MFISRRRALGSLALAGAVLASTGLTVSPAAAAITTYRLGPSPEIVTSIDLDGDGDVDLVVGHRDGLIQTWLNNGTGRFTLSLSTNPWGSTVALTDLAAADLNGDGRGDVVAAVATLSGTVSVLLGRDDGGLQAPVTYDACYSVQGVALGDINGDRTLDVAAVSNCFTATPLYNDGRGVLTRGGNYGNGYVPVRVALADLDGDGDTDIAYTNWGIANVTVLRNTGGGTFSPYVWYAAGDGPWDIVALDVDRDGDSDLAVADTFSDTVSLLRNRGDATFEAPVAVPAGTWPRSIAAADLDGDGDLDIATANQNSDDVTVLRNDGGRLVPGRRIAVGGQPHDLVLAQLDPLDRPDLAVVSFDSMTLTVLTNPSTR